MSSLLSGLAGAGGSSLAASRTALGMLDKASAQSTLMGASAESMKIQTDTLNGIANSYVDSATKSINASMQSGKAINY